MDFWERKRLEQQSKQPAPQPSQPSSGPWWQRGYTDPRQRETVPQQAAQSVPEPTDGRIDGHDVSKASHIRREGRCPECGSDGYFQFSEGLQRCYFCGYSEGRTIHSIGLMTHAVAEGPAQKARQVDSGGKVVNNYHGNIKTASEAVTG